MRSEWESKSLGELTTFINGLWKGETPPFAKVGVIRNTNFANDGSIDNSNIAWLNVEAKKFEKRKLKFGDIILEKSGGGPKQPVGRVALFEMMDSDYSFSNFTSAIRINDATELDFRFLHKFLLWKYASGVTETMQSHSTGIRNLNSEAYREIVVPLPPFPEQKRIVAILDEALAGLATATANAEKNLKNARELFESALNSIFQILGRGWPRRKLGEIAEVQSGGTPSRSQQAYWSGDLPWYSSGELNGLTTTDSAEKISRLGLENSNAKLLPKGSLLIGMYDTAAMKMSITDREAAFNQAIAGVKPNSTLDLVFVLHALLVVKATVLDLRRGVRQKNLSLEKIKDIQIKVPALQTQKDIVKQLLSYRTAVAELERAYRRKLINIAEIKQSILKKAFLGELTTPPSNVLEEAAE